MLIAGSLTLAGCKKETAGRPSPPPAEVEVYKTEEVVVPVTFSYIGHTAASQEVDVRARVEGVVWELGFEEGTSVTAGQHLFTIDPRPFEADTQIAEARVFQAKVAVQSAERDLNRTRALQSSESVSREDLDNAISLYETSVATLRLTEAELVKAKLELSYTTVTAPINGMVGEAEKKEGDLVDPSANSLLVTITAQNPMYVNFTVSEKDMLEYRNLVDSGRIKAPALGDFEIGIELLDGTLYPEVGYINFLDVVIDPTMGSGTFRAEFKNDDGVLKPGQFVKVYILGAQRTSTIMVPQRAVMQGMQGTYVYVVDEENKVTMRPVEATNWEGLNWIIESGLDAGENVIVAGTNKTAPGAEVKQTTVTTELDLQIPDRMEK